MNTFLDILKILLPAAVVFLAVYFVAKKFLENEQKKRLLELKKDDHKLLTPLRLQAYERASLFLERIAPEAVIGRVYRRNMSARRLREELLNAIRIEFDHNLSQQVYISDDSWARVKNAKEQTIKLINLASTKVNDEATATDLSKVILELSMKVNKLPHQTALEFIKREIRQSF